MAASVRQRTRGELSESQSSPAIKSSGKDRSGAKKVDSVLGERFWVTVVIGFLIAYCYINFSSHRFPSPKSPALVDSAGEFLEERARRHMETLSSYGPKGVGEHSHEVLATNYIIEQLEAIRRHSTDAHDIEIDEQNVAPACFFVGFRGGSVNCYHNLTNVIARISPKSGARYSVLVNCHYDTALSSPGASDDTISCAMMLEFLKVMSTSKGPFNHGVVFLFNGAEEIGLQGSHSFITQHKWAKNIQVFVNLEAAGAGGREFVFQSGPENPWIINTYARTAVYPSATVIGQEMFQSGLIPSDTDFRVFRDFGGLPGIDIAYVYNGYVYHTRYDAPEYIPPGCMQRSGENLIELLRSLANSDYVVEPGFYRHGNTVYFDVNGLIMVAYSLRLGTVLNVFVAACVLLWTTAIIVRKPAVSGRQSVDMSYVRLLVGACLLHTAAIVASIATAAAVAVVLTAVRPQSWFTSTWLIVPLYVLPAVCSWALCHQALGWLVFAKGTSALQREEAVFRAALLTWTLVLMLLTYAGMASAFLPMLFVAFPLAIRVLPALSSKPNDQRLRTVASTVASNALPAFVTLCHVYALFTLLVPITGRFGTSTPPDYLVGVLATAAVVFCSLNLASLLHVSQDLRKLVSAGYTLGLLAILIAACTPIGFPYGANVASPTPQRLILQHVQSQYYKGGRLTKEDSKLLYLPWDYSGLQSLATAVPELNEMQLTECDPEVAYCGWPFYFANVNVQRKVYQKPLPHHELSDNVKAELQKKEKLPDSAYRLHFICTGHLHVNVYISPKPGIFLKAWSFTDQAKSSAMPSNVTNRTHYFVYNVFAKKPYGPLQFSIDLEVDSSPNSRVTAAFKEDSPLVDISFAAHFVKGPESVTPPLQQVLDRFPPWTNVLPSAVSYQAFEF